MMMNQNCESRGSLKDTKTYSSYSCASQVKENAKCSNTFFYAPSKGWCMCENKGKSCGREQSDWYNEYTMSTLSVGESFYIVLYCSVIYNLHLHIALKYCICVITGVYIIKELVYCYGNYGQYETLTEAKLACDADVSCAAIYDFGCMGADNYYYSLCHTNYVEHESSSTCLHIKAGNRLVYNTVTH